MLGSVPRLLPLLLLAAACAKAAHEVLQQLKPDDHLFLVRAGWTGSQAFVPGTV